MTCWICHPGPCLTPDECGLPRSRLLRLLRAGCNVAEIACAYGLNEFDLRRRVRALERTVTRRRNKRRYGHLQPVALAT